MSEKYHFEELDGETREYLLLARDKKGKGLPGIYSGETTYLPLVGLIVGVVVMIATLILTFPPTDQPVREAMLQTAGFMLGGWMVVAALRVWASGKSGKYAGHFVYTDPDYLYEANGTTIEVTDLYDLREAKAVQNFNEGKYQNTAITLKVGKERKTFQVHDEERGRRMTVYLNAVSYMRDGGEDGRDDELRKLAPEVMGSVAKQVARTGEFPRNLTADDLEVNRVPHPKREGRPSTGLLPMAVTLVIGVLVFVAFWAVNRPLRDEAVFARVKSLNAKDQPPALRLYLANPAFTGHRAEAQKMLDGYYDRSVQNNIQGSDPQMKQGMTDVISALKTKPQPVVSLITVEVVAPPGQELASQSREESVRKALADKWGSTIGDELVVFAAPEDPEKPGQVDKSAKGMIDVRWKYAPDGQVEYVVEFRISPDEQPTVTKKGTMANAGDPNQTADKMMNQILQETIGQVRDRPIIIVPAGDF